MSIKNIAFALAIFATPFAMTSCDGDTHTEREVNEAAREVEDAGHAVSAEFQQEGRELEADFKRTRADIDRRIEKLEADLDDASDDAKAEINEEINELKAWGRDVDDRMDKVGDKISHGWAEFKNDSRATLEKIERDLKDNDLD